MPTTRLILSHTALSAVGRESKSMIIEITIARGLDITNQEFHDFEQAIKFLNAAANLEASRSEAQNGDRTKSK